jgi:S-adenosylmethionine decarboxylase
MTGADLFQLGTGLATGAHAEDLRDSIVTSYTYNETDTRDLIDGDRDDHFIREDGVIYAGNHLIIEVENGHGLDDEARIQQAFRDCVTECGATLLHIHTHKFSPQGVSGVAVLAESHISVHTWPEIGYGAFDVFMCGDAEPWRAVDVLKQAFSTDRVHVKELRRGEGLVTETAAA